MNFLVTWKYYKTLIIWPVKEILVLDRYFYKKPVRKRVCKIGCDPSWLRLVTMVTNDLIVNSNLNEISI